MKRVSFDGADDDRPGSRSAPTHSALACAADGCTWQGTSGTSGRFFCIAHAGKDAPLWPAITAKTTELQWFAEFIRDVQRMANQPRKGEETWTSFAWSFWADADKSMQPTHVELRNAGLYLYRMLGELRSRALGRPRPQQHVPQADWPQFQAIRHGQQAERAA